MSSHPVRILMVCTGNICRSVMAQSVLAEQARVAGLDVEVDSAGISDEEHGGPIDRRAARVLREAGHAVLDHRARQVRGDELEGWDLVLAMTRGHLCALERLAARTGGGAVPDLRLYREFDPAARPGRDLDVPDPWYGTHGDFVATLAVIERVTPVLVERLRDRAAHGVASGAAR